MSQDETTPCVKVKQPLYHNETTLVSKRHNKDSLNKDSLFIDTQSINQERLNDETEHNLKDKKEVNTELEILNRLNEKYEIEVVKESILKANKAKEAGTVINNLYAYLDKVCKQLVEDNKVLKSGFENSKSKKTKFHNFKQKSDLYTNDELEAIAKKKRKAFMEKMGLK